MRMLLLCMTSLMTLPVAALAGTCEQDFQAVGDPRNGLTYMAGVTRPGLSVSSALGQLQKIGAEAGYEVGGESIGEGTLSLLQTNVRPNIIVHASANREGTVTLGTVTPPNMKIGVEQARTELCGMLGKLKDGDEGEQIAKSTRVKNGMGRVIDVKAEDLSAELQREIERARRSTVTGKSIFKDLMLGTSTKATSDQMSAATAPIVAKYLGRKYRIDGQAADISISRYKDQMVADFLVTQKRGPLGIRQGDDYNNLNYGITCIMAPDQRSFFATLSRHSWMTLTGTVSEMTGDGMTLQDCRQSN